MKMATVWAGLLAGVVLGASAVAVTPGVSAADGAACGAKENPCPLQKWMKSNMGQQLAGEDYAALAASFDKLAKSSPDKSWDWSKIATDGAAAAKAKNNDAVKAACKSCHDQYKKSYKEKYRDRPFG